MTWEIGFMLALLVVILAAFVRERIPTELTAMSAFALLLVLGLLSTGDAMNVFSNSGPIAVGAMFILSAALEKCGAIDTIAGDLAKLPRMKLWMVIPVLLIGFGSISAFINNTPVVVVFLPVVLSLARRMQISPSKLLIPLSYGAIFGGTCTVVGTSTNIIVSSIAGSAGYEPFSMFEMAKVGVPLFIAGTLYLMLLGPRLLPDRAPISSILTEEQRREYIVEDFSLHGRFQRPRRRTALTSGIHSPSPWGWIRGPSSSPSRRPPRPALRPRSATRPTPTSTGWAAAASPTSRGSASPSTCWPLLYP